jgi:ligand-binding sensor domain-containing protein
MRLLLEILIAVIAFQACTGGPDWHVYDTSNTPMQTGLVRQSLPESSGPLWAGTYGNGLYRLSGEQWEQVALSGGGDYITALQKDSTGGLWIGTARAGAYCFRNGKYEHFNTTNGLLDNNIWDIFTDPDGSVWFASRYKGLTRMKEGTFETWTTAQGLPDHYVTVVRRDSKGVVWVGTARGGLCGIRDSGMVYLNHTNGLSGRYVRTLLCDSVPRYVGTWDGGLDYFDGKGWKHDPAVEKPVVCLVTSPEGQLWAGTWGSGAYYRTGRGWERLAPEKSGLPDGHVIDIRFDRAGQAYFSTSKGLAVFRLSSR